MKKIIIAVLLVACVGHLYAHVGGHELPQKTWTLNSSERTIKADFVKYELNEVWLSGPSHKISKYELKDFTTPDQEYILSKYQKAVTYNSDVASNNAFSVVLDSKLWFMFFGIALFLLSFYMVLERKQKRHISFGIFGAIVILIISCKDDNSVTEPTSVPASDLSLLESVFGSFSEVTTSSNDEYFYIASNGIPSHNMMIGITNWQQQIPIDHSYLGENSWSIPLNPELSDEPLSLETNFLKGAIAIAANGIPIFNPLNNRGEDANSIGELDQWGGHCGKADDYHYHLPPSHLQSIVGSGKPIAYALDGFPVYGETTEELDENLGRFESDGSYQYHASPEYPYLIAAMRGVVSIDPATSAPENQVLPQASTRGVRPSTDPLNGAVITGFESTDTNAYMLTYTLNSETYKINYNWDDNGKYTYIFTQPDGSSITETYNR